MPDLKKKNIFYFILLKKGKKKTFAFSGNRRMDEIKITQLYTELKSCDPLFLFQFTRSSDRRIIKCKIKLDPKRIVDKSVAQIVEYNMNTKQENPSIFSDDILNEFFTFTGPVKSKTEPGVFETSCAALSDRIIKLHTRDNKFFMSTTISGEPDTALIGVHVTIDIPKVGVPLLRGITVFGRNKLKEKFFTENLSVAKYVKKFITLMMDK